MWLPLLELVQRWQRTVKVDSLWDGNYQGLARRLQAGRMNVFKENLVPGMSFDQVVQWIKRNPEECAKSEMGRILMKLVKAGNMKALRRAWTGKI